MTATDTTRAGRKAPAYNGRFEPPTIGGFPLYAVIGFGAGLVVGCLAVLFPWLPARILLGVIAVAAVLVGIYFLSLGDEISFQWVRLSAWWENGLYTHHHRGDE
jgi:hypothetical protein